MFAMAENEHFITLIVDKKDRVNKQNRSIAMIARDPGPATLLASVANVFSDNGVSVWISASELAGNRFTQKSNALKIEGSEIPKGITDILLSGEEAIEPEMVKVKQILNVNPDAEITIVEDFPGSTEKMIREINTFHPISRILTLTRDQAEIYKEKFKDIAYVVPVGSPAFDSLLKEDVKAITEKTREVLLQGVPESDKKGTKIITFLGDAASNDSGKYAQLNDATLQAVLESLSNLQDESLLKDYIFVYKPHPTDRLERWVDNPVLKKFESDNPNLKVFSKPKDEWQSGALSTREVCIASDVVINLCSTAGIEQLLATTQNTDSDQGKSIPLFINLKSVSDDLYSETDELKPFAPVAETPKEVQELLGLLVSNSEKLDIYRGRVEEFKKKYRFRAAAAFRAYLHVMHGATK
jgi:hypothetical protein